ncbi:hypothetical protein BBO99_00006772 [Phytophthora kernoviae]|uniref:PD-(D/E)XK endonuclease-like domain-containing protein n=2 Tax=Phytophthora kernoviae TaxID=325452 RepID=A0A421GJU9_9STRA|nr:hypothetical protein G195_009934 [Phytophthora kernoviae 00238/432]KAG2513526.1 hypothetical protein JM16_006355 [Phytophthora kernoviae]KAG2517262.1 hypothetical protein JM18_005501 [Phytophthora kernoviae]RLN44495.1 hypothetical protein BBI17_006795 [Phytophthora kernoviae]RLN77410.1 hypothetical protein BBO99_00006772 [Phytophthora kernoviae]
MQHNATSWDGLVMDVLAMCGVQKGEDAMTGEFSEGLLRQYTDVVVDDVQRTTPAMARLVGHLCAQPSVQSSASFSQVVLEGDYCLRTQILERQLLETSEHTGHRRTITQTTLKLDDETAEKRVKMQAFAQQLLTSKSDGETAQSVVNSTQVTFVAPYLQQLRETNLTSSVSWEQSSQEIDDDGLDSDAGKSCVRVLPLTARALELLEALVKGNGEDRRVLVLISMRDSKFPGRMKRLTLPLPYDVLSKPYPIQTRAEHLEHTEQLAYQAFTLDTYDEMVLSFAELAATKREVLSRTFKPIWHEEDQPTSNEGGTKGEGDGSNNITSSQCESSKQAPTALTVATIRAEPPLSASRFWYLEMAEFLRTFVNRVILPIWRQPKQLPIADVSSRIKCRRKTENKQDVGGNKGQKATSPVPEVPNGAQDSLLPTEKLTYEPPHLSYSQISEYLRCPHRYFLARVMKLGGDTSASMMFGRALHESVAAFATTLAAAQRRGDDVGNAKALAGVEAEEAFVRAWADDGFGLFSSKEQAQFLFDRGMLALWDFMDTHYENPQAQEILHVEREFSVYVPEANVELRGVWDRIDRVAHGDGSFFYVIKEFKSNMSGAERNMRKLADESLQLKLYMYAFRKVFGEAPHGAQLQQIGGSYPHADINTSKAAIRKTTRSGNEALVLFSDKAMQEAEAAVGKVALGLRCGDFGPTPSFAECAFCPYAGSACHFTTDDVSHEPRSARNKSSV